MLGWKNVNRRIRAAALALALLAIAGMPGCARDTAAEDPPQAAPAGRYLERPRPLPDGIGQIADMKVLEDGTLALLASGDREGRTGWKAYESSDGGQSWSLQDRPELAPYADPADMGLMAARFDARGGIQALRLVSFAGESEEDAVQEYELVETDRAGTRTRGRAWRIQGFSFPYTFMIADNGDVVVEMSSGTVLLDGETMEEKHLFAPPQTNDSRTAFTCSGDRVIVSADDSITVYNARENRTEETFEAKPTSMGYAFGAMRPYARERAMTADREKDTVYYCDQNGIYAHAGGGGLIEQIVDGQGASLNLPTRKPLRLEAGPDGIFYILYEEGDGYFLAAYAFSETPPGETGRLKVYALSAFHDGRIRQAIGQYEIEQPGMRVDYVVGQPAEPEQNSDISTRDALRTLNAELLAGKGPDVFVLDGLPLDTFVEKGVLLDLTETVRARAAAGNWLAPVVENFHRGDGRVYGVPSSFEIPMILGAPETVDAIQSYGDLTRWIEKSWNESQEARPIESLEWQHLMGEFYGLLSPLWLEGGEGADEALRDFLRETKRVRDLNAPPSQLMNALDAGAWYKGKITLAVGGLRQVYDWGVIASLLKGGEKAGKPALTPGGRSHVYQPHRVIGINRNGGQTGQAQKFLETVLSESVQQYEYYDGLPVNGKVFERQLTQMDEKHPTYLVEGMEGVRFEIDSVWPDEGYAELLREMISKAVTPDFPDQMTQELFYESFLPYFEGDAEMESCIKNYNQVMKLRAEE